jgi:hypothetical protein
MADIRTPDDEVTKPGWFTLPFTEGWTYQGATYAGHSDFSVDWNRRTLSGAWLDDTGDPVLAIADGIFAEVAPETWAHTPPSRFLVSSPAQPHSLRHREASAPALPAACASMSS